MKRFDYVDLLRGLSALIVLICHYRWFWDFSPLAPVPANALLWPVYRYGSLAVQVFWALSGFVFWVAYGEQRVVGKAFWLHRFARLYPLHFLTLLIMAALQFISWRLTGGWTVYGNNDLQHFGLQLVMASNWLTMEGSFNAPIWSVSVEIVIYLAFVLFMLRPSMLLALVLAGLSYLGSGLIDQSQKMTVAAMQMADMKVWAHRS